MCYDKDTNRDIQKKGIKTMKQIVYYKITYSYEGGQLATHRYAYSLAELEAILKNYREKFYDTNKYYWVHKITETKILGLTLCTKVEKIEYWSERR
jgi:hypothetical protein